MDPQFMALRRTSILHIVTASAIGWAVFTLCQQLLVASSSFWLVRLIGDIESDRSLGSSLALVIVSLLLPYLPGAMSLVFLSRWKLELQSMFIRRFLTNYQSRTDIWTDHELRNRSTSIVSTEGMTVINNTLDYFHGFSASVLNVGLNILVLTTLVEPLLLVGYMVGLVLAGLLLRWNTKRLATIAASAQNARLRLVELMLVAWDSITLGNAYNRKHWLVQLDTRFGIASTSILESAKQEQVASVAMAIASAAPSFLVVIFAMVSRQNNHESLAGLAITLPRLFLVLMYTSDVMWMAIQLPAQRQRARIVWDMVEAPPKQFIENRVNWHKIAVTSNRPQANTGNKLEDLMTNCAYSGRITLRGANGAGKSTILLLLKQKFGDLAFLLPAKHQLLFGAAHQTNSTGEQFLAELSKLNEIPDVSILLLDEWDANLDPINQQRASAVVDALATRMCVVEVRHRE